MYIIVDRESWKVANFHTLPCGILNFLNRICMTVTFVIIIINHMQGKITKMWLANEEGIFS